MIQSIKRNFSLLLVAILSSFLHAQEVPTPPLDIPLKLSGTFG